MGHAHKMIHALTLNVKPDSRVLQMLPVRDSVKILTSVLLVQPEPLIVPTKTPIVTILLDRTNVFVRLLWQWVQMVTVLIFVHFTSVKLVKLVSKLNLPESHL